MDTQLKPRVFSIGYAKLSPDDLLKLVTDLDVTLIDVRSRPSGRVKRGFSRADLTTLLGTRYEYHGKELGGLGAGVTRAGLDALAADPRRLLLMCQEHSPSDCHRHHMIGVPLAPMGVDVYHVFEGEVLTAADLKRAVDEDTDYECVDLADVIASAK